MRYHMKVLIVEDEVQLCESLKELLEAENCSVDYVHDGLSAEDYIMTDAYDVVVLDIMLPGMDGIEVLTRIRERGSTVPVLLLTAKKSPNDKISGLDKGADDYLTKPFAPGELMARLRALYRRKPQALRTNIIAFSNISLNESTVELQCEGRSVQLTSREFDLIHLFMSNPGHVFTKEAIISKIWPLDSDVMYNAVEAHISSLRKKMKRIGSHPEIVTIRGIGYKLEG